MSLGPSSGNLPRGSLWEERGSGVVSLGDGHLSGELAGDSGHRVQGGV